MKLIVHIGTGTIIDPEDGVVAVDIAGLPDDADDADILAYAEEHGKRLNVHVTPDVKWGNIIAYSPVAVREEALEMIGMGYAEGDSELAEVLNFVANTATDDELDEMASYILDSDEVWLSYKSNLIEGAKWAIESKKSH